MFQVCLNLFYFTNIHLEKSAVTFRNGVRVIGSTADTILYLIVGMAFTRVQHYFDWGLIGLTLAFVLIFRFIVTIPLALIDTAMSLIVKRPRIKFTSHLLHLQWMPRSTIAVIMALFTNFAPFITATLMITLLSIVYYSIVVPVLGFFQREKKVKLVDEQMFEEQQYQFEFDEIDNALTHLVSLEKSKNTLPANEESHDMEIANIRALTFVLETIVLELDRFTRSKSISNENMLYNLLENIDSNDLEIHKTQWESAERFGNTWYEYMDHQRMQVSSSMSHISYILYVLKRRVSNSHCDVELLREKTLSPGSQKTPSRTPLSIREPSWMVPTAVLPEENMPNAECDTVLSDDRYSPLIQSLVNEGIVQYIGEKYQFVEWARDTDFANYLYQVVMERTSAFLLNESNGLLNNCNDYLSGNNKESAGLLMTTGVAQLQSIVDEMQRRNEYMKQPLEVEETVQIDIQPPVIAQKPRRRLIDFIVRLLFIRGLRKEEKSFIEAVQMIENAQDHRERKMALHVAKRLLKSNRVNMHRIWEYMEFDAIVTRGRSNVVMPKGQTMKATTNTYEDIIRDLTEISSVRLERERVQREIAASQPTTNIRKRVLSEDNTSDDDVDTFGCPSPKLQRTSSSLKHAMHHVKTSSYSILSPRPSGLHIRTSFADAPTPFDGFDQLMLDHHVLDLEHEM
jgi:hypothetical protein